MDISVDKQELLDDLLELYCALLAENLLLKRAVQKLTTDKPMMAVPVTDTSLSG
jgi:hypothetical protein